MISDSRMRYLVDTHAFLWTTGRSNRLPNTARLTIEDPANEIFLSAVSLWEVAIKLRSGRLELGGKSATDLMSDAQAMDFRIIGIEADEAASHSGLSENTHFDPFDRMLIWQAIQRDMTLISGDAEFERFRADGLKLLWK